LGGRGTISVAADVVQDRMKAFNDACLAKQWEKAREIHFSILQLHREMFLEANPIPVKSALNLMGLIHDELRLPLVPALPATRAQLAKTLERMGIIKP